MRVRVLLPPAEVEALAAKAQASGCMWGNGPNLSGYVRGVSLGQTPIGSRDLEVARALAGAVYHMDHIRGLEMMGIHGVLSEWSSGVEREAELLERHAGRLSRCIKEIRGARPPKARPEPARCSPVDLLPAPDAKRRLDVMYTREEHEVVLFRARQGQWMGEKVRWVGRYLRAEVREGQAQDRFSPETLSGWRTVWKELASEGRNMSREVKGGQASRDQVWLRVQSIRAVVTGSQDLLETTEAELKGTG